MESSTLKKISKASIGAVIFNIIVEIWIFIDISYNIKWTLFVFACIGISVVVFFIKAQRIKNCIFNSVVFTVICIIVRILMELIKSKFNIYRMIFDFELGAGAGFAMITIYICSIIIVVGAIILSMFLSRWNQKHNC